MAWLKIRDENNNFIRMPVLKGDKGDQGEQGPQGIQGEQGPAGPKGDDYEITEEDYEEIAKDVLENIPIASPSNVGLVKYINNGYYGVGVLSNGDLYCMQAPNNVIDSRNNPYRPITSRNLDYAVKRAMADGVGAAWSETEKAAARERMGANFTKLYDTTITERATAFKFTIGKKYDEIYVYVFGANFSAYPYISLSNNEILYPFYFRGYSEVNNRANMQGHLIINDDFIIFNSISNAEYNGAVCGAIKENTLVDKMVGVLTIHGNGCTFDIGTRVVIYVKGDRA